MLEYSTTFFLFLSTSSLCGFQSYNFCLDGALKNSFFSIAGCMKVVKVKGVYSWLCGFLQYASFRTLKVDKLTTFEVWSLNEVDGNKLLTYMVMPILSCQSVIIVPSCIMMVIDNEVPKIRVTKMLLQ